MPIKLKDRQQSKSAKASEEIPYILSNIYISKEYINSKVYNPINCFNGEERLRTILDRQLSIKNPVWEQKEKFARGGYWKHSTEEYLKHYTETDEEFILPRNFDLSPFIDSVHKIENRTNRGRVAKYKCSITLKGYQKTYLKENSEVTENDDKILNMPCGTGKTLMGIYLSHLYKTATLVLVPTHYLARQWGARINSFTNATVHFITSTDKVIPLGKDFYICSFDLMAARSFTDDFTKEIGHVILDEAHKTATATYLPVLDTIPSKRRTALSATFRRSDGMHQILHQHFGKLITLNHELPKPTVHQVFTNIKANAIYEKSKYWEEYKAILERHHFKVMETQTTFGFYAEKVLWAEFKEARIDQLEPKDQAICHNFIKKDRSPSFSHLYTFLAEYGMRRLKAIKMIEDCMRSGRTVLFISNRKKVLKSFYKYFAKYKPMLLISETNKLTPEQEKYLQNDCKLIFGVSQIVKEGLDIDRLDTLLLFSPLKDTEQAAGRIAREVEGKKPPLFLYLLDDVPMCWAMWNGAEKYLKINTTRGKQVKWNYIKSIL